jgi:hypothetical protein
MRQTMSGEGGRDASRAVTETNDSGTATLVCGTANHDDTCRQLAREPVGSVKRIRVTTGEGADPLSETGHSYDTGVYDGLGLSEAGIVVSDTIDTLERERRADGDQSVVLCIDALPEPDGFESRERLFRFLHALTRRVSDIGGDCHAHVGVEPNASLVTSLEPLFDDVRTATGATPSGP